MTSDKAFKKFIDEMREEYNHSEDLYIDNLSVHLMRKSFKAGINFASVEVNQIDE